MVGIEIFYFLCYLQLLPTNHAEGDIGIAFFFSKGREKGGKGKKAWGKKVWGGKEVWM